LALSLMCLVSLAFAQKKPLTHDVYDDWKSLTSVNISSDGVWAGYRINPQVGDAVLELKNLNTNESITVDRVSRYSFSANGQYVAAEAELTKDNVVNVSLVAGLERNYSNPDG